MHIRRQAETSDVDFRRVIMSIDICGIKSRTDGIYIG